MFFSYFTEIARVRGNLFHLSGTKQEPLELPEPIGPTVTLSEKVYVPVKEHPDVSQKYAVIKKSYGVSH